MMGFLDNVKKALWPKNFKYLDDLIHSGEKEIVLDSDIVLCDGEESEYNNGIRLDVDDITINGNGHTIDAQGKTRIFYFTGKNITIKHLILKNGFAERDGGAIYNGRGELTITESILTGNNAYKGGAIYNDVGEIIITSSTLNENTAEGYGGAINDYDGELTIIESILIKNTAEWYGGAIDNN